LLEAAMSAAPSDVKSIFQAAVDKPPGAERDAFLDHACAGDAYVPRRVEALIQAHDQPGSFLDKPILESGSTLDQPPTDGVGARIGLY
jgi:hypothetical protein